MLQLKSLTSVPDPRPGRRGKLLEVLASSRLSAAVISHPPNVRYLTGFTGSNGILYLSPGPAILFTDPRYEIQAGQECDCRVRVERGSTWAGVWRHARGRVRSLGLEATRLSHDLWEETARQLGRRVRLEPLRDAVETLRMVKSAGEIAAIRASVRLCSQAFEETLPALRPGMTEQEAAAALDYRMRLLGAEAPAFETIAAAGARSALPHARPTRAKLRQGGHLLVDMGACLNGYMSDMTRVVHFGPPPPRLARLHAAVLEAQLAAIAEIRPGAPFGNIDARARRTLASHGLARYFTHSTGHGLGLEIHEPPRLGARAEGCLQAGMVVTVEPGVYLAGTAGVRIEDTVLVTETGVEILTPTSKELLVLPS